VSSCRPFLSTGGYVGYDKLLKGNHDLTGYFLRTGHVLLANNKQSPASRAVEI